jgi:molybdopterin-guanine dinucleotide biosynthesis protein A
MGRDKALLQVDGETLVARAARRLATVVGEVLLADRGRGYLPAFASVPDGPGAGPAAGLLGAVRARPGRPLLALACDLPAIPEALLALLAAIDGFDWVVPESPRGLEPLCALYGPAALAALARRVAEGRFALHELAAEEGLRLGRIPPAEHARFGSPVALFRNLNRVEDLGAEGWP